MDNKLLELREKSAKVMGYDCKRVSYNSGDEIKVGIFFGGTSINTEWEPDENAYQANFCLRHLRDHAAVQIVVQEEGREDSRAEYDEVGVYTIISTVEKLGEIYMKAVILEVK